MVPRTHLLARIRRALARARVVALVGPRQCGKTTLARQLFTPPHNYFDLENPIFLQRLAEPMTALAGLKGTVIIDEVQRRADLFPILRVLVDRRPCPARWLVLGSASPGLLKQASESLAGRIEVIEMSGFSLAEVGARSLERHWLRGGFPQSYLARSEENGLAWRREFVQTFLERDLPQIADTRFPAAAMLRFWTMLAHYHGNLWNAAELARSFGVSEPTVRRYLDLLSDLFMVRQLQPWHENLAKRQVKSPKIYIRDSGLLHQLLGIRTSQDLLSHPKLGASWEGYAIEEALRALEPGQAYFWATHAGAEIDLLVIKDGRRLGIEVKRADAPGITPSMRTALEDLKLEKIAVLYPGATSYDLSDRVAVVPVRAVAAENALVRRLVHARFS